MKKQKKQHLSERISVFVARGPQKAILLAIVLFNIIFFFVAALVISWLSPSTLSVSGFWPSVFYTITMILDAGCIQFVINDVGAAGVTIIIVCLLIVLIGMVTFTGAVIGYLSNYISQFIENANAGTKRLKISGHTIILNWNNRASEIVNDLLYSAQKEKIVILVSDGKDAIRREIENHISTTISKENALVREKCKHHSRLYRLHYIRKNQLKNNLAIIIREGDIFSTKQLSDIGVQSAKTVIILGRDIQSAICKFEYQERVEEYGKGNSGTVKALIQVADMTAAESSADNQKIVVEVEDDWTFTLVKQIIAHKERAGKCNIVPVPVNHILGLILSQFSVMPELNQVYSELFSNKGVYFASMLMGEGLTRRDENRFIDTYLGNHCAAVPVTLMDTKEGIHAFFMTNSHEDITKMQVMPPVNKSITLNSKFWLEKKNVVILGHNSKMDSIMVGFDSFRGEWNLPNGEEILNIIVIDDTKSLDKHNRYRDVPYVTDVVDADIYDRDIIYKKLNSLLSQGCVNTSILILSDDMALNEEIDAKALTYLIYVQDILQQHKKNDSSTDFRLKNVDIVVEVLNPKNYDIVSSYSVNNIVISNRYISKMITQISEQEEIFEFYRDILTYDTENSTSYESKELYIKKAQDFFVDLPEKCTAAELIRSIFAAGPENNKSVLLGYIRNTELVFFGSDQTAKTVELQPNDKLVIFSNH